MRIALGSPILVLVAAAIGVAPAGAAFAAAPGPAGDRESAPVEVAEPAPAGPELHDPMLQAKQAYDLGRKLYDEAKYEDALGSFLDAQRLYASPDHHFNIARCYEALGRYELAVEYYRAYLRSDPGDRANIESTIERIEAIITSKDEPAAQPALPEVEPQPEPVPPTDGSEDASHPGRVLIVTGAVLTGVGVAVLLGGGVGAGAAARDRSDQVDDVFQGGNPDGLSLDATRTLDEEGRRLESIQVAGAVVGTVLIAGGVTMLALGVRKKRARPSAAAMLGRGLVGVTFRGRF